MSHYSFIVRNLKCYESGDAKKHLNFKGNLVRDLCEFIKDIIVASFKLCNLSMVCKNMF